MTTLSQDKTAQDKAAEAEAAVQKKKDDELKEYLTVPPEGRKDVKPPDWKEPPDPNADKIEAAKVESETEAMRKARNAEAPKTKVPLDDDDEPKPPAGRQQPIGRR